MPRPQLFLKLLVLLMCGAAGYNTTPNAADAGVLTENGRDASSHQALVAEIFRAEYALVKLQGRSSVIYCFTARDSLKPVKDGMIKYFFFKGKVIAFWASSTASGGVPRACVFHPSGAIRDDSAGNVSLEFSHGQAIVGFDLQEYVLKTFGVDIYALEPDYTLFLSY